MKATQYRERSDDELRKRVAAFKADMAAAGVPVRLTGGNA